MLPLREYIVNFYFKGIEHLMFLRIGPLSRYLFVELVTSLEWHRFNKISSAVFITEEMCHPKTRFVQALPEFQL